MAADRRMKVINQNLRGKLSPQGHKATRATLRIGALLSPKMSCLYEGVLDYASQLFSRSTRSGQISVE
jgi:hypothetical protein